MDTSAQMCSEATRRHDWRTDTHPTLLLAVYDDDDDDDDDDRRTRTMTHVGDARLLRADANARAHIRGTSVRKGARRRGARCVAAARPRSVVLLAVDLDGLLPPDIDGDLEGLQEEAGAVFDEQGYVSHFGSVTEEAEAIASGAAVVDRSDWGLVRASGPGALRALQVLANDDGVKLSAPGSGFEITLPSGDVAQVYVQGEGFILVTPPRATAKALAVLGSVMPSHEFMQLNENCALLTVCGPKLVEVLRSSGLAGVMDAPVGSHQVFGFENRPVVACHTPEYGVSGLNLIVDEGVAGQVWATITRAGVVPTGNDASNAALVAQKRLLYSKTLA